jgi:hypothetical protein
MEYYSTKICTKCFSAQQPYSRFCDNCGNAFDETAATDGNISVITNTFFKQQVQQTRPLFWLCIIIVGMLAAFGFAQAGMFRGGASGSAGSGMHQSVSLTSQAADQTAKSEPAVPAASDTMLDLNNSVFEMRDAAPATHSAPKRKATQPGTKTVAEPTTNFASATELAAPMPAPVEPIVTKAMETEAAKPAENGSATPKAYIRGPMGGCYYISASGTKRYVDRSLCN